MKSKKRRAPQEAREDEDRLTGVIHVHHKGFGFVTPDDPFDCPQDIFIPKHLILGAINKDHVEVVVDPIMLSEKGPEGKVVAILKRAHKELGATVEYIDDAGKVYAYSPLLGSNKKVLITEKEPGQLKIGDRVIVTVKKWGKEAQDTLITSLVRIVGNIENPMDDIPAAIADFALNEDFSEPALSQAKSFGTSVTARNKLGRVDLTHLDAITIDPDTAKDFDDALAISKEKNGTYHLSVHIADVAHYVPPSSPLDKEARERCNSTYFPGFCLPMLPEELSNALCSLKPRVVRLTVSVLMHFDQDGNLLSQEIVRGFIKSRKRFTYEEAKEIIDGKAKSPYATTLQLLVELCYLLKKKRYERGSIDFALPELVILTDKQGRPTGKKWVEYDISHQLVEEYMLKANEVVATALSEKGAPLIYRIHEEPEEANILEFYKLARTLGFQVPESPTQEEVQRLFESAKETAAADQLAIAFIRSMRLAIYSPQNIGHYGLSLEYYCHFTSPIRRYSDLVTQRLLFNEAEEDLNIEEISLKCSEQERVSFKAESGVKLLKKLRLLQKGLKEDPGHHYEAIVTKIKPFGLHFEVKELLLEGFLHIADLEDDYFIYYAESGTLQGRSTGKRHYVGEKLSLFLLSVNLIRLESKWSLILRKKDKKRKKSRRS